MTLQSQCSFSHDGCNWRVARNHTRFVIFLTVVHRSHNVPRTLLLHSSPLFAHCTCPWTLPSNHVAPLFCTQWLPPNNPPHTSGKSQHHVVSNIRMTCADYKENVCPTAREPAHNKSKSACLNGMPNGDALKRENCGLRAMHHLAHHLHSKKRCSQSNGFSPDWSKSWRASQANAPTTLQ